MAGLSVFLLIRRMRAEGKSLREMLRNPMFNGRSVEVSLLGGMATVKLGQPSQLPAIGHDAVVDLPLLEDPESSSNQEVSQLAELARLLEKDLITVEEFNQAKRRLLNL
ncbi:SHOCT domain-containing protein [Desulfosarcina cetonica]|uniref:SHOCT domain-containing protein n=1 Tax=Desulfosarcina cetonica TaxID=90730 RepID=UPI0012ECE756|nr:SHOCT domain-containing protein [Desulfosarcina cetonica]